MIVSERFVSRQDPIGSPKPVDINCILWGPIGRFRPLEMFETGAERVDTVAKDIGRQVERGLCCPVSEECGGCNNEDWTFGWCAQSSTGLRGHVGSNPRHESQSLKSLSKTHVIREQNTRPARFPCINKPFEAFRLVRLRPGQRQAIDREVRRRWLS